MKRVMRLLPPWIFGGLLFSFSQMGFMNKEFTVDIFFSPTCGLFGLWLPSQQVVCHTIFFANVSNGR